MLPWPWCPAGDRNRKGLWRMVGDLGSNPVSLVAVNFLFACNPPTFFIRLYALPITESVRVLGLRGVSPLTRYSFGA